MDHRCSCHPLETAFEKELQPENWLGRKAQKLVVRESVVKGLALESLELAQKAVLESLGLAQESVLEWALGLVLESALE